MHKLTIRFGVDVTITGNDQAEVMKRVEDVREVLNKSLGNTGRDAFRRTRVSSFAAVKHTVAQRLAE